MLFMHVPKTGGAALSGALANRFAQSDCLELYFGPERDLSDVDRFRYVTGHVDASLIDGFRERPFVLTVLRDPIDRALSHYAYTRSFPEDPDPEPSLGGDSASHEPSSEWRRLTVQYSIGELISRAPNLASHVLGNRQARALTACDVGEERLDHALEELDRCDFVGLTERLDESVGWITRRLGWRDLLPMPRSNVTGARLRRDELPAETLEALARLTEVDRALHLRGAERHERRLEEWSESADPRDPSVRLPDASPVSDLPFDQPILGGGWMNREPAEDGSTFCWMGSTRRAWVEMVAARGADRLEIEIPHVLSQEVLHGLRVAIDHRVVPHTLAESDGVVIATVPLRRRHLRSRRINVSIEVDHTGYPQDVNPDSFDHRELAIAVRRMALRPA
jgi:hypothetical protein